MGATTVEPVTFYLGAHHPHWLRIIDVPLFISARRLRVRKTLPQALGPWALDSGGFTELRDYGGWQHGPSPAEYAAFVKRCAEEIGNLVWAAPQDWMCEPQIIHGGTLNGIQFVGTHLSVEQHQELTIDNYLELAGFDPDRFIPVIQGYDRPSFFRCVDRYLTRGIDLFTYPTVGVGSVCRRQNTDEIAMLFSALHGAGFTNLHGFGVKTSGLGKYAPFLRSADSMSWSYGGRRVQGCTLSHKNEANCLRFALQWRQRILDTMGAGGVQLPLGLV